MCISLDEAKNSPSFLKAAEVMNLTVEEVYRIHLKIVTIKEEKNAQAHADESGAALRFSQRQPRSRISTTDELIIASVPAVESTCEVVRKLACYMAGRPVRNIREYKDKAVVLFEIIDRIGYTTSAIAEYLRQAREYFNLPETAPSHPSFRSAECAVAAP